MYLRCPKQVFARYLQGTFHVHRNNIKSRIKSSVQAPTRVYQVWVGNQHDGVLDSVTLAGRTSSPWLVAQEKYLNPRMTPSFLPTAPSNSTPTRGMQSTWCGTTNRMVPGMPYPRTSTRSPGCPVRSHGPRVWAEAKTKPFGVGVGKNVNGKLPSR